VTAPETSLPSGGAAGERSRTHRVVRGAVGTPFSLRVRPRVVAVAAAVAAIAAILAAWTMVLGDFPVPLSQVLASTVGLGTGEYDLVVRGLRLPRTLAAAGVGVALGTSGAIFQGLVRNPLVSPDIIGVMSGASVAAVALIVTGGPLGMLPIAAFVGAVATAALIYALTWRAGISGNRLVLVGIGINAVMVALTTFLIVRFPIERVAPAVLWQTGTLHGRGWTHVTWIGLGLAVLLPSAAALMSRLRTIQLGDDAATALGTHVEWSRAGLLVVGSSLAAVAVAVAGPVGFVALMVPHIARMLLGPLTGGVLVVAGLIGAVVVLASDLIAQHAFSPISLPVGVVTAAVGAPYFLFLLYRSNRGA
jgi:iron complex transport system permease protein